MSDCNSDSHPYLTDLSERDKPWDVHRAQSQDVESLYKQCDFVRYSERIAKCSEQLGFVLQAQDDGERRLRLRTAKFCRVRHCPVCQWRRSMQWRSRFHRAIPQILKDYPKARFIFLTVTVRNCPIDELGESLNKLNKAWNRLTKRKIFPGMGWVKAIEVTRSESDEAHPHIHAVLMVEPGYFTGKRYLSQAKWTELWQACMQVDYRPVVNVKVVKPSAKAVADDERSAAIASALVETLKYSVKPEDLLQDASWLAELTRQLHKKRTIALGGVFKQYLSEADPEDLITEDPDEPVGATEDDDPFLVFDWSRQVRRYRQT